MIKLVRSIEHAWRYGDLAVRIVQIALIVLLLVLATSIWQLFRLRAEDSRLQSRIARLQTDLPSKASAISTADPPDFVNSLPDAPSAVQVMQILQQAAEKEGGSVTSLQAEDHPPTESTLGRLDLVISIKATYPATLIVLREALDRYPGATVRQFTITRTSSTIAITPTVPASQFGATSTPTVTEAEAHVVLALWRRPLGIPRMLMAPAPTQPASNGDATPGQSLSDNAHAATASSARARRAP